MKERGMASGVISKGEEGEVVWFGGGAVRFKVTSADTGGAFGLIEDRAQRGKTTPLHSHPFAETFYVLEGEMLFHVDGQEVACGPGSVVSAPPGIPHAFLVTSDQARFLGLWTPGEVAEAFIREGGDVPTSPDADPPPLDIARVVVAGEKTGGMVFLGPPPFAMVAANA
jgi:quercetin dioxygenase-like cupin family protein